MSSWNVRGGLGGYYADYCPRNTENRNETMMQEERLTEVVSFN